jgi:hypothetical protein
MSIATAQTTTDPPPGSMIRTVGPRRGRPNPAPAGLPVGVGDPGIPGERRDGVRATRRGCRT